MANKKNRRAWRSDKLEHFLWFTFKTEEGLLCLMDFLLHLMICIAAFYLLFSDLNIMDCF